LDVKKIFGLGGKSVFKKSATNFRGQTKTGQLHLQLTRHCWQPTSGAYEYTQPAFLV